MDSPTPPSPPFRLCLSLPARGGWALSALAEVASEAEAAGFDLLLFGWPESDPGADPLSIAAALTARTRTIGLGAVVAASAWAPFHMARAFAAFDLLSGGRAAWVASSGWTPTEDPGGARFAEYLGVVEALFDSWTMEAMVFDQAAEVFVARDAVRRIAHAGAHYAVDGPLPGPSRGRPRTLCSPALAGLVRPDLVLLGEKASAPPGGAPRLRDWPIGGAGDAATEAARMAERWAAGDCEGFNLLLAEPAPGLRCFAGEVAAALRARLDGPAR